MRENVEEKIQPTISAIEELAGGIILLTWSIAFAIVLGNCLASSEYLALMYATGAFFVIIVFTPFGGYSKVKGPAMFPTAQEPENPSLVRHYNLRYA